MGRVLVFKTSVKHKNQVRQLQPILDELISLGENWNFDLEDCDNILRFETRCLEPERILKTLKRRGYACEEL